MAIPPRIIIIWSGSTIDIPEGWFLCNGSNDTPDLRNRFIVGSGDTYALNATGGFADATLVDHNHTGSTPTDTIAHTHTYPISTESGTTVQRITRFATSGSVAVTSSSSGNHSHTLTISTEGESATGKNLPPYFALAYIMKGAN